MILADPAQSFSDTVTAGPLVLALLVSFLAGIISFASPCILPLVPGYLSFLAAVVGVSGSTVNVGQQNLDQHNLDREAGAKRNSKRNVRRNSERTKVTLASVSFVLGFTLVFVVGSASLFGLIEFLTVSRAVLQRIGGIITIVMGFIFLGYFPYAQRTIRLSTRPQFGVLTAPVLGAIFALGWTPCLGPTLSAVLSLAAGTHGTVALRGIVDILAYCLGLGVPFIVVAWGSARAVAAVTCLRRYSRLIQVVGGVLLICVGIALVTGWWDFVINYLRYATISDWQLPV